MPIMQGRVAKLNVSLNTSSKTDLSDLGVNDNNSNSNEMSDKDEDEDMDVPENIEEIIEMLLSGLRDMVCLKGEILLVNFVLHLYAMLLIFGDEKLEIMSKCMPMVMHDIFFILLLLFEYFSSLQ